MIPTVSERSRHRHDASLLLYVEAVRRREIFMAPRVYYDAPQSEYVKASFSVDNFIASVSTCDTYLILVGGLGSHGSIAIRYPILV